MRNDVILSAMEIEFFRSFLPVLEAEYFMLASINTKWYFLSKGKKRELTFKRVCLCDFIMKMTNSAKAVNHQRNEYPEGER
jgi:hypothetical protein